MLTLNSKSYFEEDRECAGKGPRVNVTLSRGWGSQTLDHWVHQQLVKRTFCSCGYLRCGQVAVRCVTSAVDKLTSGVRPQVCDLRCVTSAMDKLTSDVRPQVCDLRCVTSAVDKLTSGVLPQLWTSWPQVCYLRCGQADLRCINSCYLSCGQADLRCVTTGVLPQLWTSWPQVCYLSCGEADLSRVTSAVDKLTFLLIRQLWPQGTVLTLHLVVWVQISVLTKMKSLL